MRIAAAPVAVLFAATLSAQQIDAEAPAVFQAVAAGDVARVGERLGGGDDPDMHWRGIPLLATAIFHGGCANGIVSRLLESGADPDRTDPNTGASPLLAAVNRDDPGCIELLVEHGADPLGAGGSHPALHQAVGGGYLRSLRALLELGVSPEVRDEVGFTPLMVAVTVGDSRPVTLLLDGGADACARDRAGRTAADIALAAGQRRSAERLPRCD